MTIADDAVSSWAADDFGHIVHARPGTYLVAVLRTAQSPASLTRMLANADLRKRTLGAGGRVYLDGSGTP